MAINPPNINTIRASDSTPHFQRYIDQCLELWDSNTALRAVQEELGFPPGEGYRKILLRNIYWPVCYYVQWRREVGRFKWETIAHELSCRTSLPYKAKYIEECYMTWLLNERPLIPTMAEAGQAHASEARIQDWARGVGSDSGASSFYQPPAQQANEANMSDASQSYHQSFGSSAYGNRYPHPREQQYGMNRLGYNGPRHEYTARTYSVPGVIPVDPTLTAASSSGFNEALPTNQYTQSHGINYQRGY